MISKKPTIERGTYEILRDFYKTGLRGRLPEFIASFLEQRTMSVRIGKYESEERDLENGVPPGSVLSVTPFALKVNGIVQVIPENPRLHISLYMDDLQIGYNHSDPAVIQGRMQECLNKVACWAHLNRFKFSPTKSKAVHFQAQQRLHNSPTLKLDKSNLKYCDTVKFLGLMWDKLMNWTAHIAHVITKCKKSLSLLRCITANEWGADQRSLVMLYRELI